MYYEIHLTCDGKYKDYFKELCLKNNIKYAEIIFPLALNKDNHLMTSYKVKANTFEEDLQKLYFIFKDIDIVRTKIESDISSSFKYIENHLSILNADIDKFKALNLNWAVSYNSNKEDRFSITKRIYNDNIQNIKNDYIKLKDIILENKLVLDYCIFDNNLKLDCEWI